MRRDLCTVVQLGFAFFLIFSAFNSQGFIEITVLRSLAETQPSTGISQNSGYYSLAIIYFVFTISNLIAPPVIKVVGSKWAQVIGAICYSIFMLAFLNLHAWILYLTSAILGFGAALLWTGNGMFLVQISRQGKMARNSGILWAMLQSSLVAGAFFLLFMLSKTDLASSYISIYSVFSFISIAGVVTLILLPSPITDPLMVDGETTHLIDDGPPEEDDELTPISLPERNFIEEFKHTFSLLKTRNMAWLSICFMYSGVETTFYTGVYSACLSAATALNKGSEVIIPYNAFCMGAGQIIGGLSFGMGGSRFNKSQVILMGMVFHIIAFFLCFLNVPMESPLHKTSSVAYMEPSLFFALLTGFLLGLADSCWNTQIYTLLGSLYKHESSSAFALFKFFQSLAACVSFYYGSVFLLHWQLLILCIGAALAAVAFFNVENKANEMRVE